MLVWNFVVNRHRVFGTPKMGKRAEKDYFNRNGHLASILPLAILSLLSVGVSHLLAGEYAVDLWGYVRLAFVTLIPTGFLLSLAFLLVVQSIFNASRHRYPESDHIDVTALWRSLRPRINPLTGYLAMMLMCYGITGTGDLNEIYRVTTTKWWDAPLWQWEAPLFSALRDSWINIPVFWDRVYFMLWTSLFISLAIVFHAGNHEKFVVIALATVIAFYLTRMINLAFPTMGPAFWRPEFFELASTASGRTQEFLRLYMLGKVQQTSMFPATMAMPSLHVSLAAMAAWALAGERRWTLWLSIPWTMLIWISTVILGWHYLLDGVGGILVAALSLVMAKHAVRLSHSHGLHSATASSNEMVSRSD